MLPTKIIITINKYYIIIRYIIYYNIRKYLHLNSRNANLTWLKIDVLRPIVVTFQLTLIFKFRIVLFRN